MVTGDIFNILDHAPYGAYAVDVDQVIHYWNAGAERILGYSAAEVMGRRCYDVLGAISVQRVTPFCIADCPTIRVGLEGGVPKVKDMVLRCAKGQPKRVLFTPLFLPQIENDPKLLLFLFYDLPHAGMDSESVDGVANDAPPHGVLTWMGGAMRGDKALTAREREMLQLVALGLSTNEIARRLHLSPNTVRNHLTSAREKLQARTKLEAVLAAQRLGLIESVFPALSTGTA